MKTAKKVIALILAISMAISIPLMAYAEGEKVRKKTIFGTDIVGNMYLLISNANPKMPHIWLYFENTSDETQLIGQYHCPPGDSVSMGAWKDRGNGAGIHYNLERYWVKEATYHRTIYLKATVTALELKNITLTINNHNYWSYPFNCGWFATCVWNKCSVRQVPYLIEPHMIGIFLYLYGARSLNFTIKKLNDPDKVYKHTDNGPVVVYRGALWTQTGV